jgi:hypothetical protein
MPPSSGNVSVFAEGEHSFEMHVLDSSKGLLGEAIGQVKDVAVAQLGKGGRQHQTDGARTTHPAVQQFLQELTSSTIADDPND